VSSAGSLLAGTGDGSAGHPLWISIARGGRVLSYSGSCSWTMSSPMNSVMGCPRRSELAGRTLAPSAGLLLAGHAREVDGDGEL